MRAYDIIIKKRSGHELSQEEIDYLIQGYTNGNIPDYQVAAFLMAVFFQGLTSRETSHLTMAMVNSGDVVDLSSIPGIKVDKHSTGGVGDKTTLILTPLVAAAGVPVAKMSGRGLGHTGGTIDKLESIPGFKVSIPTNQFLKQVSDIKLAVASQTGDLAPADKKLYALRDVTATVDSIPLIASSIMSKKIASGADAIVLDVKVGSGAFMRTVPDAKALAETMVEIGRAMGRKTTAVITGMDQPLGNAVGNALEVEEALNTLSGKGPQDLRHLCLELGSLMLVAGGITTSSQDARGLLQKLLDSGKAMDKFKEMVKFQGGDETVLDQPGGLPPANNIYPVISPQSGYISSINAESVGRSAMLLGAGRRAKEDSIDPAVGIVLERKTGDNVRKGERLAQIHVNDTKMLREAESILISAYSFSAQPPLKPPLIIEYID